MAVILLLFFVISLVLPDGVVSQGPVANFPVNDCNITKQCVGSPDICLQTGICRELLKYSYDLANPEKVKIELYGTPPATGSTNFWVAMGVNFQPGQMAGTLVNECVYTGSDGMVNAFTSYNSDEGYSNRRVPGQEKLGISEATGSYNNGILNCTFSLDRVRTLQGHQFSLSTPLYLLLGDGPARELTLNVHRSTPWTSSQPYTLAVAKPPVGVFPNLQALNTIAPQLPVPVPAVTSAVRLPTAPGSITDCGRSKGCLATPAGCLVANACQSVISYVVDPNQPGQVTVELWRAMVQGDQYVALGVNPTTNKMPGAGVIACVNHGNNIEVLASYNPSYYSVADTNPTEGITVLQTAADGSRLYCKFNVQTKRSYRTATTGSTPILDVDLNNPNYMFLASGPATLTGQLRKHDTPPIVSEDRVTQTSLAVTNGVNKDYYKAHGGLMVGAWMFLASIGIFTARYYKKMWLGYKPCGLPLWFHIHRPIMLLAVSAAIAGFVVIFVKVGQWTATPVSVNPHPIIGIIAFILGLIQPIMAAFRPHPGTANRPIFNWAHFLVGFSAHIMAIAAIFLGLGMPQMSINNASIWIMVAFSAFHALWLTLLQLIEWIAPHVGRRKTTTVHLKTINGGGATYEETVIQEPERSPASTLKTIMWFTHVIVVGGLTTAILVLIGISP